MSRIDYQLFVIVYICASVSCIKVEVAQKKNDNNNIINNLNPDSYLDALQKNREEDGSQR